MKKIVSWSVLLIILLFAPMRAHAEINFRGAWIASVANIDWPSRAAVGNTDKQKAEMIFLLDSLQSIGINAIVFQVRPTADALYLSELEPISHWLTGHQGRWGEQQGWDPLEWVIEQAHQRGIAVHVWINPYRVNLGKANGRGQFSPNHIIQANPGWFWQYNGQWYFDPGRDETRDWICMVVEDIVSRYDIQGIHMDDYFYPYPVAGEVLPDAKTFHDNPRGFTNIADWRRNNVDMVIQELHTAIKAIKPDVEFGISPFGVWRNNNMDSLGSATRAGLTNYDHLYADVRLWMKEGWIDYVVPQLYWEIGKKTADYEVLARWWADNSFGCKVYIGMAPYRLGEPKGPAAWRTGNEIARQMRLNRTIPEITGECFYSTTPLLRNPRHICDTIKAVYQAEPVKYQPELTKKE